MRPLFTFQAVVAACLLLAIAVSASPNDGLAQARREVTVGVPRLFPPYYQLDEDGNPSGFAVDVMNEVAKQAGFKITYRVAETGGDNFEAIRQGDVDIIPSLGINDFRKQYVAFTQPVDTFRIVLFVRADTQGVTGIDDMVGRPVAVVVDNVGYRFLENRTDIQLKVFPTFTEALFALLSAKVDGFVYPEPVTLKLAREAGVSGHIKSAAKPLSEIKRAMAVRKDNMELLAVLDQAIGNFIASPEYQQIYVAWFGKPVPFWTLWRVVLAAGILSILSLMVMAWWRYRSVVRLNRALQEAEERFRAVVTYSPTKIHIKTAAGRYMLINPLAEKLFGITDEEGRGKTSFDLFEEDVAVAYTAHDQTVMESGQAMEEEEEFILEDGVHTFLTTKFPIRDGSGKVIAVGAIGTDITERKRTEDEIRELNEDLERRVEERTEELLESESRLKAFLDYSPVATYLKDLEGRFIMVGKTALKWRSLQPEDVLGRTSYDIYPKEDAEVYAGLDRDVIQTRRVVTLEEEEVLHDGETHTIVVTKFPVFSSDGVLSAIGGIDIDITERKRLEGELRRQERLATLGQLTATVSHELRNPLGVIRTSAFIVHDNLNGETPRVQRSLERIERSVIRCDRIIDELLDFTRISEIEADPTAIDAWLEGTLNEQTLPSGIALRLEFGMQDVAVPFDHDRFRRVIINVFDNGCQAMIGEGREDTGSEEHTLTVRTQKHNGRVEVIFEDTGPGIPPDVYERIFEPLYSTKGFGVGLGLPVVKQIMEQHGGGIEIESEEGRGARVCLWLPISRSTH